MTTPNSPDRDQVPPTGVEIAALTRRPPDLSDRGRDADPGERAALLADTQVTLAGRAVHAWGDPADAYTDDEIAAIIQADVRGDDAQVQRLQAGRPRPASVLDALEDDLLDALEPEEAARAELVASVSWALWARDVAIERGDTDHAVRFARDSREAMAAAEAAGITREQLAAELDYPGGADELDGEHIGIGIGSGEPLTAAQLAGWDTAGDGVAHPGSGTAGERADDLWGPLRGGADAAHTHAAIRNRGTRDPDEFAGVDWPGEPGPRLAYPARFDDPCADTSPVPHTEAGDVDRPSGQEWSPPDGWSARATGPDGSTTFEASGYYSDAQIAAAAAAREACEVERAQALQDAPWTAQGVTVDTTQGAVTDDPATDNYADFSRGAAAEEDTSRREQLNRWHDDDHITGDGDVDGAGWAR
jgi:hypothetical protein